MTKEIAFKGTAYVFVR